jgi:hypothetical protein
MTLIMEAAPTTTAVEQPIQPSPPPVDASTGWAATAARAHALLSQTMTDEELDELVDATPPFVQAIVLPTFLFG